MSSNKFVIVVDQDLPVGVIANTAAVLSLSIGKLVPTLVGADFEDAQGQHHHGITTAAIPVLRGTAQSLGVLREALAAHAAELTVVDLIDATRTTASYDAYIDAFRAMPSAQRAYQGIAVFGPTKLVAKYTGSLGLLR